MTEIAAISSALLFGCGDFTGGYASKRIPAWTVVGVSQLFGLWVLAIALLLVPVEQVTAPDIVWGGVAGLAGLLGLALFYPTLAAGSMSIVAPVTAAAGALVPVIADAVTGGELLPLEWAGIAVAMLAIGLVSIERGTARIEGRMVGRAIAAGVAFGTFFIALSQTSTDSGLWPLVSARAVAIPLALIVAAATRSLVRPTGSSFGLVAVTGTFDVAATVAVTLALQAGSLAVSATLSSLYPAVTALLAIVLLHERPAVWQTAGIGLAVVAVAMLAV